MNRLFWFFADQFYKKVQETRMAENSEIGKCVTPSV